MNDLEFKNTFNWFKKNWFLVNKPSLDECPNKDILIIIINKYNSTIDTIITDYSKSFKNNGKINDRKTFANNIKKNKFKKLLFGLYEFVFDDNYELNSLYTTHWNFNSFNVNNFILKIIFEELQINKKRKYCEEDCQKNFKKSKF
jgi:hypothetical protein